MTKYERMEKDIKLLYLYSFRMKKSGWTLVFFSPPSENKGCQFRYRFLVKVLLLLLYSCRCDHPQRLLSLIQCPQQNISISISMTTTMTLSGGRGVWQWRCQYWSRTWRSSRSRSRSSGSTLALLISVLSSLTPVCIIFRTFDSPRENEGRTTRTRSHAAITDGAAAAAAKRRTTNNRRSSALLPQPAAASRKRRSPGDANIPPASERDRRGRAVAVTSSKMTHVNIASMADAVIGATLPPDDSSQASPTSSTVTTITTSRRLLFGCVPSDPI